MSTYCRFLHSLDHFEAHENKLYGYERQIKVDSIFTSYRIQSNASNEITLSLSSEALLAALRSASSSTSTSNSSSSYETEEVVMKLAKKNDHAVLSFEISGMTRVGRKVRVAHDVKIEVMKPGDVARLAEPLCPEPDVRANRSPSLISSILRKVLRVLFAL